MKASKYKCPICNGSDMTLRHEVNFVYSYEIDEDEPGYPINMTNERINIAVNILNATHAKPNILVPF